MKHSQSQQRTKNSLNTYRYLNNHLIKLKQNNPLMLKAVNSDVEWFCTIKNLKDCTVDQTC